MGGGINFGAFSLHLVKTAGAETSAEKLRYRDAGQPVAPVKSIW